MVRREANNKVAKWFENRYKRSVGMRKIKHIVYDLKYRVVWIMKYKKRILDEEVTGYLKEVFGRIAEEYGFRIDTMELMENHVYIFAEAPPGYSPGEVVRIMKSISTREAFKKFPRLRKELWFGELWNDGYFVRSVEEKLIADIIRKYIKYQTHEDDSTQLDIFSSP